MTFINKNVIKINDYPFERLKKLFGSVDTDPRKKEINLSIGQPHHKYPLFVNKTISKHKDKWNLYPPSNGIPKLRKAYSKWLKNRFKITSLVNDDNILPLSGTKEGLFSVALSLDIKKIIIPNPFYQVYFGSSLFQNPDVAFITSLEENNYLIDLKKLESKLRQKKTLVYFCSPTNPQGKTASFSYLKSLITLVRNYNATLIIDECYIDVYTNTKPVGALEICDNLRKGLNNILIFHSLSKRSNVAGIRSGFVVGDSKIIKIFRKLRSYSAPTIPIPLQFVSASLWEDEKHVIENRLLYKKKFDYADKVFSKYKKYERPDAGFYLWLNVKNGEEFTKKLYSKYRIKVMPGLYLSKGLKSNPGKKYIRIALVNDFKICKTAIDAIAKLLKL